MDYISIGFMQKAHGIEGELKVRVEERYYEDFLKNERIYIDVKGAKVPYFIENLRGGGALIVKLEEVDDRDAAVVLQSREIFLRKQDLIPDHLRELETEEESLQYAHIQDFTLIDKTLGEIGPVREVIEMPQQEMAVVIYKGREFLIPLAEQWILEINQPDKSLRMDLPEGLLE